MGGDRPVTVAVGQFGGVIGVGLARALGEDHGVRVVGAGLDHAALRDVVVRGRARVVVLDEDSAVEPSVVGRLCAARAGVGLVVLAHRPTRAYAARVRVFGVGVCIATEASAGGIVWGVRLAAGGERGFVAACEYPVAPAARVLGVLALTRREREVLKLLSNGRKHAEVAEALNVGVETARTHAKHVYRKLGVSSRKGLLGIEL